MSKLFFIVGLRASGTSILRSLVENCPEVKKVEFEPHDLMFTCSTRHLIRYKHCTYHKRVIQRFLGHKRLYGAKIALNTGVEAMNWRFLDRIYREWEPKYIFIRRNPKDNYMSLKNKDEKTVKGVLPEDLFIHLHDIIWNNFVDFHVDYPGRSFLFNYDLFVKDPKPQLSLVESFLNITFPKHTEKKIHKPKFWSCLK